MPRLHQAPTLARHCPDVPCTAVGRVRASVGPNVVQNGFHFHGSTMVSRHSHDTGPTEPTMSRHWQAVHQTSSAHKPRVAWASSEGATRPTRHTRHSAVGEATSTTVRGHLAASDPSFGPTVIRDYKFIPDLGRSSLAIQPTSTMDAGGTAALGFALILQQQVMRQDAFALVVLRRRLQRFCWKRENVVYKTHLCDVIAWFSPWHHIPQPRNLMTHKAISIV